MPNILTHHYDNARTGWNGSETALTPISFQSLAFGRLFTQSLDGAVLAQPLCVEGLQVSGAPHNVVLVCTGAGSVYAFDADQGNGGAPLWQISLLGPGESAGHGKNSPGGTNALASTPVIDASSNTMYYWPFFRIPIWPPPPIFFPPACREPSHQGGHQRR